MDCRLTVISARGIKQWKVDDWTAGVVLAALSADPATVDELLEAVRRYQPEHQLGNTADDVDDLQAAASNDLWCVIDLRGKTVIGGGAFELPSPQGAYETTEPDHSAGFPIIWMDTPPSWQFHEAGDSWQSLIDQRAAAANEMTPLDARKVMYGDALCRFLAQRVRSAHRDRKRSDESDCWELNQSIHADWLMTARPELGDRTPREVLLADRNRIQLDLEHRSHQWSQQGFAPPPLPVESDAYRCGGFGTAEIVIYFDLIRSMLVQAWQCMAAEPDIRDDALAWQLSEHLAQWLELPYEEGNSPSARQIIESERRRLPMTSDGRHFDCDCPICQAEADGLFGSSPMFIWFDGHHLEMEDNFAFSLCEDFKEWKEQQQIFEDPSKH